MGIKLISEITVKLIQKMGGDHMVVAAAKVSTCGEDAMRLADPSLGDANAGLINYLMKCRHGTPFEHACLTFFVHAPAAVWWEWVRHRIGHSFNLESGRYHKLQPVFWVPRRSRSMIPAKDSKPARPRFVDASPEVHGRAVQAMTGAYQVAWDAYEAMIGDGIANEVARTVLGFGIYYSGWVTINPRSLMAFLSLRTRSESATFPSYPAAEIEEAALELEGALQQGWPLTYAAFHKNGRVAP